MPAAAAISAIAAANHHWRRRTPHTRNNPIWGLVMQTRPVATPALRRAWRIQRKSVMAKRALLHVCTWPTVNDFTAG